MHPIDRPTIVGLQVTPVGLIMPENLSSLPNTVGTDRLQVPRYPEEVAIENLIISQLKFFMISRLPSILSDRAGKKFYASGKRITRTMVDGVVFLCKHLKNLNEVPDYLYKYIACFFASVDRHPTMIDLTRHRLPIPIDFGITYGLEDILHNPKVQRAIYAHDIEMKDYPVQKRILYRLTKSNPCLWVESIVGAMNDKRYEKNETLCSMHTTILDTYIPDIISHDRSCYPPPDPDDVIHGLFQMSDDCIYSNVQCVRWILLILDWGIRSTCKESSRYTRSQERRALDAMWSPTFSYFSVVTMGKILRRFADMNVQSGMRVISKYIYQIMYAAEKVLPNPMNHGPPAIPDPKECCLVQAVQTIEYPEDACERLCFLLGSRWMMCTAHRVMETSMFQTILNVFVRSVHPTSKIQGWLTARRFVHWMTLSHVYNRSGHPTRLISDQIFDTIIRSIACLAKPQELAGFVSCVSSMEPTFQRMEAIELFLEEITHAMDPNMELRGKNKTFSKPSVCPISMCAVWDPVRSPHVPNHILFERRHLLKWVQEKGTCPLTRKVLRLEDVEPAWCAVAEIRDRTLSWMKQLLHSKKKTRKRVRYKGRDRHNLYVGGKRFRYNLRSRVVLNRI